MKSMLFVHAGDDHARSLYAEEGRAYWSQALPLVLEKHGYLDVEAGDLAALSNTDIWDRFGVVLIARLPEKTWTSDLVERVTKARARVVVEGPLPAGLEHALGVTSEPVTTDDGTVRVVDPQLHEAAAKFGFPPGGTFAPPVAREVPLAPDRAWNSFKAIPINPRQNAAWQKRGWQAAAWSQVAGADVLAEWLPKEESGSWRPAIIRSGNVFACCFSLFAYLAQAHTSAPFEPGEFRTSPQSTGLEVVLLALIDQAYRAAGWPRARVLPWPDGAQWVLNIRHDFDRPMTLEQVDAVLAEHDRVGSCGTWYWRARHLSATQRSTGVRGALRRLSRPKSCEADCGNATARQVAAHPHQEVALHTELLWADPGRERRILEDAVGLPVRGSSAHGDARCFRFQGAPNILWADRERLTYTEAIQHAHIHPYRFAALTPTGLVRPLDVLCLPHHLSFDLSTQPDDTNEKVLSETVPMWAEAGALVQIMNHPDVHIDALFAFIRDLPRGRRLDWTAADASDWWRRTHVSGALSLEVSPNGSVRVSAQHPVDGVCIELLYPDGTSAVQRSTVTAGTPSLIEPRRQHDLRPVRKPST
jgi:hypothetical protein